MTEWYDHDRRMLRDIIGRLFDHLSWDENRIPDWSSFKAAFRDDAVLYPSARPAAQSSVPTFVERMEDLRRGGTLKSLLEKPLAIDVTVFGNTALVYASYDAVINGAPSRGANAFLFVKDNDGWAIGALAWDNEGPEAPFCPRLSGS